MVTDYRYSAQSLCELLELHPPTPQQRAIIEAPLDGVYRVVAGAGSGKTETMALRVVWLVANGLVAPHEVLGLTFTRKAAGELGGRIAERIRALPRTDDDHDVFQMPQVSTYNAFASRLFQDYAVYLGVDGDQEVAGSAAAWSLARRVVQASEHPTLPELDLSVDQLTNYTWQLSSALSEHAVAARDVVSFAESFQAIRQLPPGGRGGYPDVDRMADAVGLLPVLCDLVAEFRAAKAQRGMVEYSDQVRLGLEVARSAPDVISALRTRHKVVLLDEYQDTSVLQTQLLATLFADHPVMSVGDPLQAIYGWRGASAANLDDFPRDFADRFSAVTFGLQTSWRNPVRVLSAANQLCEPLRDPQAESVGTLEPAPQAAQGVVDVSYQDSVEEEAQAVADWFASRLTTAPAQHSPSAALLLRERKHQHVFAQALTQKGIPVHILGIGGLLGNPLVADLIAGLAVVHRRYANGELIRVLTSGRFRLGVSDLFALSERAKWLGLRDSGGGALDESLDQAMRDQALGAPRVPLIDAVDYLASKPDDHGHWQDFSPDARSQLREAARLIAEQRRLSHEAIADQALAWERSTGLDIEWMAHPDAQAYREAREAFFDAISQYQSLADEAGARGFLDWLEAAEWRDSLQPQSAPAEPGCVQILTIHGAKGLEWDLVAVAGLREGGLPGTPNEGYRGWLRAGVLPYSFRGDREFLPHLPWQGATTRKELLDTVGTFREQVRHHYEQEERRLAYVALTRTKSDLLLSGSFYTGSATANAPSVFLQELAAASLIDPLPDAPSIDGPPESGDDDLMTWPGDPLGSRRLGVEKAATAVIEAIEQSVGQASDNLVSRIDRVVEDERLRRQAPPVTWPVRIPASQFDRWVFQPEAMLQARRQPRPPTTGLAQARGNQFHTWVESYFHIAGGGLLGPVDTDGDVDDVVDQDIVAWQDAFESSEFATLTPVALEREIHLPLAGHLIICKIDAVFEREGRIQIVDWKTGAMPATPDDMSRKSLQLALYRLAWSEWSGIDMGDVDAVFWFSGPNRVLHPGALPGRDELEGLINQAKSTSV